MMKFYFAVLSMMLLVFGMGLPAGAIAECVVYEHADFRGRSETLEAGETVDKMRRWNDRISSLQLGRRCRLTVYEHEHFGGDSILFERSEPYVGDYWNDRISSMHCDCGRHSLPRADACLLYQHADFQGDVYTVENNQEDPSLWRSFNDIASSLVVPRQCELWVFEHKDFEGRRKPFGPGRYPYVGDRWNDRISSAACRCSPRGWRR